MSNPTLETLLRRFAEIDGALEIAPGHGIVESILANDMEAIMAGDFELITEGWDFDPEGPEWAKARLAALVEKWKEAA